MDRRLSAKKMSVAWTTAAIEQVRNERRASTIEESKIWNRAYEKLQDRLANPDDEAEVMHSKVAVAVAAALCGTAGVGVSLGYIFILGTFLAAIFSALLTACCIFSIVYLLLTRKLPLARSALGHGLVLTAIGIHWSFGGSGSSSIASWALLGPSLMRITGASFRECVWQLSILLVFLVGFGCAEMVVGAENLTPQRTKVSDASNIVLGLLNIICPGIVSCSAVFLVMGNLQVQKNLLAEVTQRQSKLTEKLAIERRLAYELVTHSFPRDIAVRLFEFFQSVADEPTRLDEFQIAPSNSVAAVNALLSAGEDSESPPMTPRSGGWSTGVFGDYFSTFAGQHHPFAVILFGDIVGFTSLASTISPTKLVHFLDVLFGHFDELCLDHDAEKIKTIGDCYMCVAWPGDLVSRKSAAESCLCIAEGMHNIIRDVSCESHTLSMRIGVHCGDVVSGIIGKTKFAYDIWGDAVNVASRMESTGVPGATHVSAEIYSLLKDDIQFTPRGLTDVKGKGKLMTYLNQPTQSSGPSKASADIGENALQHKLPAGVAQVFNKLQRNSTFTALNEGGTLQGHRRRAMGPMALASQFTVGSSARNAAFAGRRLRASSSCATLTLTPVTPQSPLSFRGSPSRILVPSQCRPSQELEPDSAWAVGDCSSAAQHPRPSSIEHLGI